ncbi:MAG: tandem-95 repeat protein [Nanoarchaeota archaeon]
MNIKYIAYILGYLDSSRYRHYASKFIIMILLLTVFCAPLAQSKTSEHNGYNTVTDTKSLVIEKTSNYNWFPKYNGKIKSIKISGSILNNGSAKVYLEDKNISYLLFDSELLQKTKHASKKITRYIENNSIWIDLGYNKNTNYDTEDDGKEPVSGIIDLSIKNTSFNTSSDDSRLCSRWEIYSIDSDQAATICFGSEICCRFIGLKASEDDWQEPLYLNYGMHGATNLNMISAQIIYVDYSLNPENPHSDIRYSNWANLSAEFINDSIKFEDNCIDTCSLTGFNASFYNLHSEISGTTIHINKITYVLKNDSGTDNNALISSRKPGYSLSSDIDEVLEKRTVNSKSYISSNGKLTLDIYSGKIHFEDENGTLQDIDTNILPFTPDDKGVAASNNKFDFAVTKNVFKAYFGDSDGRSRFMLADKFIGYRPESINNVNAVVEDNSITYKDIWDDIDLSYSVGSNILKEEIILKKPASKTRFSFILENSGLTAKKEGKQIGFYDNKKRAFYIARPYMYDSTGLTAEITLNLRHKGQTQIIDIILDKEWLNSSERVYPVTIDPTTVIQPDSSDGKDTYVWEQTKDTNFGITAYLSTGRFAGSQDYYSLVQFNISSIPDGAIIDNATLNLFYYSGSGTENISAFRLNNSWNQGSGDGDNNNLSINGTTWNERWFGTGWNTSWAEYISQTPESKIEVNDTIDRWISWDITNLTKNWFNGSIENNGILIAGGTSIKLFYSSEGAQKPRLTISFSGDPDNDGLYGDNDYCPNTPSIYNNTINTFGCCNIRGCNDTIELQTKLGNGTNLNQLYPDTNYVNNITLHAGNDTTGNSRLILSLNLSSLPQLSSVLNSTLMLFYNESTNSDSENFSIHQILNQWTIHNTTWYSRNGSINWTSYGGDYNTSIEDEITIDDIVNVWKIWNLTSLTQRWIDGIPNFGVMIKSANETHIIQKRFISNDHADSSQRPKLSVSYSITPYLYSSIPNLTWPEDIVNNTINLSVYFKDTRDDDLNFTSTDAANVTISIDNITGIVSFRPLANWSGLSSAVFYAYTPDNKNVTSNTIILNITPVNDPPYWNTTIAEQQVIEDSGTNNSINLTLYIADLETSSTEISFSVTNENPDEVDCKIHADDILNFTPAANFTGVSTAAATCNITPSDGTDSGRPIMITINVTPVNDPPNIVSYIPNLTWPQNISNTSINLSDYFTDIDGDDLNFTSNIPQNITVQIDNDTGILNLTPDTNWNGSRDLVIYAIDQDGLSIASNTIRLNITYTNYIPYWNTQIPNQQVAEDSGTNSSINLTGYIADMETASIDMIFYISAENVSEVNCAIHKGDILNFTPAANFTGVGSAAAYCNITASDDTDNSTPIKVIINVTAVNDAPSLVSNIPNMSWAQDITNNTLNLTPYFSDIEGDDLNYTSNIPSNVTVTINNNTGMVYLTSAADYSGVKYITFRAYDPGGLSVSSNNITLNITPVNSNWKNITPPEGIFEPYNATLVGTHINTFSIKFENLSLEASETIACNIKLPNRSILTIDKTGTELTSVNYSLNYTVKKSDPIINSPTSGYIPWILKNCSISYNNITRYNQTKISRIYIHDSVYWTDNEITRAVACEGSAGVYFNNTGKCEFNEDTMFALQMRNGNPVNSSCFNAAGTACSDDYCKGIYFPTCDPITYFSGYGAATDDPNGYATFSASFASYSTNIAYTRYVNSNGTFKLRITQTLAAKTFTITIYNLSNVSSANVYGAQTSSGVTSLTTEADGSWNIAHNRLSTPFTGTLDLTFNISFSNASIDENRTLKLVLAYGSDTNQGNPPYFNVTFSPQYGFRNDNESENSSAATDSGGRCGDEANNDFDYISGTWSNSYDCFDPDCNGIQGDNSQSNEFGSGKTGLCNYLTETNCSDEFDNDYDYSTGNDYTDCHDADCFNIGTACPSKESICNDSQNNDWDYTIGDADTSGSQKIANNGTKYSSTRTVGLTDCEDIDCNGSIGGNIYQFCSWGYETNCSDAFDNDALQLYDCRFTAVASEITMPTQANAEYDCAAYCRATNSSTETGAKCDDNIDNDWDAIVVTGYYTNQYTTNSTKGSGIDCRWGGYFGYGTNFNPDEDCNMTVLGSGYRCELGKELNCTDGFDNDYDNDADGMPNSNWGSDPAEYLATFGVSYGIDTDFDDYDCQDSGPATESINASWCFDNIDNDLDAYYWTGSWTANSSTGIDCNDPDCEGVINPDNALQSCSSYEYNATDSIYDNVSRCSDGYDNDIDGETDCADLDCYQQFSMCSDGSCKAYENISWNSCMDSIDNDGGRGSEGTDCGDTDCIGLFGSTVGALCQTTETNCHDNFDNDKDGVTDCADHSACDNKIGIIINNVSIYCKAVESNSADCFDGFDNDGDGDIDCDDSGCNKNCSLSTITGNSPITLPTKTGTTSINSVTAAYISSYTNKVKKGGWYNITFKMTTTSTNAQWTIGTASGTAFNKSAFNASSADLTGPQADNFTLSETANGFVLSSNNANLVSGYTVTFTIKSNNTLASSTYELTYAEAEGSETSLSNLITHEIVEDTVPVAQSIQIIPNNTGVNYGSKIFLRANITDNNALGLCDWYIYGNATFNPPDSIYCNASFLPTKEGTYHINVTPIDYYANTGAPISVRYVVNLLPTSSSITLDKSIPFYNQSNEDMITINATFNVINDTLGTCTVIVRNSTQNETVLETFTAKGNSCYNDSINISGLNDGLYAIFIRVTETTEDNIVQSDAKALFVCSDTQGACKYADFNANNNPDICDQNYAPSLYSSIPDMAWPKDISNTSLNLTAYFTDINGDNLTYASTNPANITVDINNLTGIVNMTPAANWSGTRYIIFYAFDPYRLSASSNNVTLNITTQNSAPQFSAAIPNMTWPENTLNTSLNLQLHFSDNNGDALGYTSTTPSNITATIDNNTGIVTLNPDENWNGISYIIFYAFDPGGLNASSNNVTLNITAVNDAPTLVSNIPNMTWPEDTVNTTLNLTAYFSDIDGDDLNYTNIGAQNITVEINNDTGIVTITPSANYTGTNYVIFYAYDKDRLNTSSNNVTLNITAVNDAPTLLSNIPNMTWNEDRINTTLNLTIYFSDIDGDDLNYSKISTPNITVEINNYTGIVTITPLANYSGTSYVIFYAYDKDRLNTSSNNITLNITAVNDAPALVSNIPNMTWNEDTINTTLNLTAYFTDIDGDDLNYSKISAPNITVEINNDTGIVTITPSANYTGTSYVIFYAYDKDRLNASSNNISLNITAVNDAPALLSNIPNMTWPEDTVNSTLNLTAYFTDIDGDDLNYSKINAPNVTVEINNDTGIVTITPSANYTGTSYVIFYAYDKSRLNTSSNNITLNITEVNDAPALLSNIPNMKWNEDTINTTLNLTAYFTDIDGDDLNYSKINAPNVTVEINNDTGIVTITPSANYTGTSYVIFYAYDKYRLNASSNNVSLNITAVNDAPYWASSIPDQQVIEDSGTNNSINLTQYVLDLETASTDLVFYIQAENTSEVNCIIDKGDMLNFTPAANFTGVGPNAASCNITLSDTELNSTQVKININVTAINDAPYLTAAISNITWPKDISYTNLDLDIYFADVDRQDLNYTSYGPTNITISINNNTGAVNMTPSTDWSGVNYIIFYAHDPDGAVALSNNITLNVTAENIAPNLVSAIPNMTWPENIVNSSLNLTDYFTDLNGDDLNYTSSDPTNISISIDNQTGIVTMTPAANWSGISYIVFYAYDIYGLSASSNNISLNVSYVNNAPYLVLSVPNMTLPEDMQNTSLNLTGYFSDIDRDDLNYTVIITENVTITIDNHTGIVTIVPFANWTGISYAVFYAYDRFDLNASSNNITLNITPVNDAPYWTSTITEQQVAEDSGTNRDINLTQYASDLETGRTGLYFYITAKNISEVDCTIDKGDILNFTPAANFSGVGPNAASCNITLSDLELNSTQIQVNINVTAINDNPYLISNILNMSWPEDILNDSLNLSLYFADIEDNSLNYSSSAIANISVTINNNTGIVTFDPSANWSGLRYIIFYAYDSDGASTISNNISINITSVNDNPYLVTNIPNMSWLEDTENSTLNLTTYFSDVDGDDLNYTSTATVNITVAINNNTGIVTLTPSANYSGTSYIVFYAYDQDSLNISSNNITLNITAVNDAPYWTSSIAEQQVAEDSGTNSSINLTQYCSDIETAPTGLVFYIQAENSSEVDCTIDKGDMLNFTPAANFTGVGISAASCNITLSDTELNATPIKININVTAVNDPPYLQTLIPNISWQEDTENSTLNLTTYFSDVDGDDLNYTSAGAVNITVAIDNSTGIVTLTPSANYSGTSYIVFYAYDPDNLNTSSNNITLNITAVNDPPYWTSSIAEQQVAEDSGTNNSINLTLYCSDIETAPTGLVFYIQAENTSEVDCIIDKENMLNFTPAANFTGVGISAASCNITLSDTELNATPIKIDINVTALNDPPHLQALIPNITWPINTYYDDLDLDSYFSDVDSDELNYTSTTVENINITINNITGIVNLSPQTNWSGIRYIQFTAYDPDSLSISSNNVTLNITSRNIKPSLASVIPGLTWPEDTINASLNLENYFSDINGDDLNFTSTIPENITVSIDNDTAIVTLTPDANWTGTEDILFYAYDPSGLFVASNSVTLTVTNVNDQPILNLNIPDMQWQEDTQDSTLNLSDYFSDIDDGDDLNYTATGAVNITAAINNNTGIVTLTPSANWTGITYIIFYAYDQNNLNISSNNVTLNITAVNDPPYWTSSIAEQQIAEDSGTNSSINLTQYASDIETASTGLAFYIQAENTSEVLCIIDKDDMLNFTPAANFTGVGSSAASCNITLSDTELNITPIKIIINVTAVNDPPYLQTLIPNISWPEDTLDTTVNLESYFSDVDGDNLNYTASDTVNITAAIDNSTGIVTLTPSANWSGTTHIIFYAYDKYNLKISSNNITLNITAVNDPPYWTSSIAEQQVAEDSGTNSSINLTQYCSDIETASTGLVFYIQSENTNEVDCKIDRGDMLNFTPAANFTGVGISAAGCNITLSDTELNATPIKIIINVTAVNDPPYLHSEIEDFSWSENSASSNTFDLDDYFADIDGDNLNYTVNGNINITVTIASNNMVSFTQPADWYGIEHIIFTANDTTETAVSNNVTLTVVQESPSSSPSGGGGGGGGGGSNNDKKTDSNNDDAVSKFFNVLNPTIHGNMYVSNDDLPVTQLYVEVNRQIEGVNIVLGKIEKTDITKQIEVLVYRYLEITAENLPNQDITKATIKFKIENSWLADNNLKQDEISLYRFNRAWTELDTDIERTDKDYTYYIAQTPGFSYFAIAKKRIMREKKPIITRKENYSEPTEKQTDIIAPKPKQEPSEEKKAFRLLTPKRADITLQVSSILLLIMLSFRLAAKKRWISRLSQSLKQRRLKKDRTKTKKNKKKTGNKKEERIIKQEKKEIYQKEQNKKQPLSKENIQTNKKIRDAKKIIDKINNAIDKGNYKTANYRYIKLRKIYKRLPENCKKLIFSDCSKVHIRLNRPEKNELVK